MNKDIFNVYEGLKAGTPGAGKKEPGNVPVEFTVPISPELAADDAGKRSARWTYERFTDAQLGEIYHEALSHVKVLPADAAQAEASIKELRRAQGWFNAEEVSANIKKLLSAPAMARFFPSNAEVFNEQKFCDADGELLRMDKVIVTGNEVWVVDYKTGAETETETGQIKKYMAILQDLHKPKPVRGFIVRVLDGSCEEIA